MLWQRYFEVLYKIKSCKYMIYCIYMWQKSLIMTGPFRIFHCHFPLIVEKPGEDFGFVLHALPVSLVGSSVRNRF